MTEKEIIADMECCLEMDCERCSRNRQDGCATGLYLDSVNVMKLMQNAIECGSSAINELKVENTRLQHELNRQLRSRFDTDEIVSKVMRIVRESCAHGECQDNWGNLSLKMRQFLDYIEASDKYIVVLAEEMPEYRSKKSMI